MKTAIVSMLLVSGGLGWAGPATNDAAVILVAIPEATSIQAHAAGFSITTPSGTRTVYKTSTGYYVEGGAGSPNRQIIRTATGFRVESSATRGAAFGNRKSP